MDFTRWQVRAVAKRWLGLFRTAGKQGDEVPPVEHPERNPRTAIGTSASYPAGHKPPLPTWSESFIFAGGSAFLLLLATLFPDYWYVSFFALTPFLYKIISAKGGAGASGGKARPGECLRLGFIFGLCFFSISVVDSLITSPLSFLLKLLSGTGLFALFGWALGWARQRWGFNPFLVVFLWVGLELGLVRVGFVGGLLGEAEVSHTFFGGLVALFGFLTVSTIIVLFNSLLVLAIVKTLQVTRHRGRAVQEDEGILDLFSTPGLFAQRVYLVPESRAPPLSSGI